MRSITSIEIKKGTQMDALEKLHKFYSDITVDFLDLLYDIPLSQGML